MLYLFIIITIVIEIGTLAEPEARLAPGISPLNTCLPFLAMGLWDRGCVPASPGYRGDGDVNSGPQACTASASPTEPSCRPSTLLATLFLFLSVWSWVLGPRGLRMAVKHLLPLFTLTQGLT